MSGGIKTTVQCDFRQITELLRQLPDEFIIQDVKKVQAACWQIVADEAKRLCPVKTGRLREMIVVKVSYNKNTGFINCTCGIRKINGRERVRIQAKKFQRSLGYAVKTDGLEYDSYYAIFVEFGVPSHNQHPEPFMRPAFDSKSSEALEQYQSQLRERLEKRLNKLAQENVFKRVAAQIFF